MPSASIGPYEAENFGLGQWDTSVAGSISALTELMSEDLTSDIYWTPACLPGMAPGGCTKRYEPTEADAACAPFGSHSVLRGFWGFAFRRLPDLIQMRLGTFFSFLRLADRDDGLLVVTLKRLSAWAGRWLSHAAPELRQYLVGWETVCGHVTSAGEDVILAQVQTWLGNRLPRNLTEDQYALVHDLAAEGTPEALAMVAEADVSNMLAVPVADFGYYPSCLHNFQKFWRRPQDHGFPGNKEFQMAEARA